MVEKQTNKKTAKNKISMYRASLCNAPWGVQDVEKGDNKERALTAWSMGGLSPWPTVVQSCVSWQSLHLGVISWEFLGIEFS